MMIVRRKSEVFRFGLFLLLLGLMAYFVAVRMEAWRVSLQGYDSELPAQGPLLINGQDDAFPLDNQSTAATQDFFADFRMERERNRSALRETLLEVMERESIDAEARKQAGMQYIRVGELASLEGHAETMLKAKGFADAAVFLSEGSVQVVVRARELTQQQYLQVVDMVSKVTGVKSALVQVMAREW